MSGGGGQPTTTTQVSKVELPQWVTDASQNNYKFAQQIAAKPLVQYGGPTVAGVSSGTQQAWDTAANSGATGQPDYNAAEAGYANVGGSGPSYVTPGMLANTDLAPYMNPYTNDVVNTSLAALNQQREQAIMGNADKASSANAFGGSRQGITDAVTNSQSAMAAGQLAAQLNAQNFTQAQAGATGDINRQFSGALANQTADQAQKQDIIAASQGLSGIGDSLNRNNVQNFMMQSQAGQGQQAQEQAVLDANKAKFDEANNYDVNRLNILLSSLGMSPYGKTQTTNSTTSGGPDQGTDWAQAGLGALSIFGALVPKSDRTLKTNIKQVGVHPTGIPIHSYNFKGTPKSAKMIGPMAQDVRKALGPAAAPRIGGKLHVNLPQISAQIGPSLAAGLAPTPATGNPPSGLNPTGVLGRAFGRPPRPMKNRLAIGPSGMSGALANG
jgi:hypothetical protein